MATVSSSLVLQDKMSSTFRNAKKAANDANSSFKNVNLSVNSLGTGMSKATSKSTSFFKSLLAFEAVKRIFSMITGQLDDAIKRFDTLNNYTKVMHNLGVSEEDANASRERLANGLKGLPTTLDTAVLAVQRFTAANDNVAASTEMYLALNNALLAGGASQELQASAMEQWAQAYSKGKPDMMEWRALLQAMPGQLKQVAKAMGKTTDELGKDLRAGKTSMNEFMKTVTELNTKGIDGFDSFEQQARNATDGIGTSVANLKAAISRGWVEMLEGANAALSASGLPKINEIITNLGTTIENTMQHIGQDVIPALGISLNMIKEQMYAFRDAGVTSSAEVLSMWTYLGLGIQVLGVGIQAAIGGIQIAFLALVLGAYSMYTGAMGAWYALQTGVEAVTYAIVYAIQVMVNTGIQLINLLIDAFNTAFSAFGANVSKINEMTIADKLGDKLQSNASARSTELASMNKNIDKMSTDIQNLTKVTGDKLDKSATSVQNAVAGAGKSTKGATTSGGSAMPVDWSNLNNAIGNSNSGSGSGGKAVKTTSTDKNLLSDDDIQLLLDVATRDYKLNYQQITPNITLTFGDIRESADVDDILDRVADKLEEIYDANLEVAV